MSLVWRSITLKCMRNYQNHFSSSRSKCMTISLTFVTKCFSRSTWSMRIWLYSCILMIVTTLRFRFQTSIRYNLLECNKTRNSLSSSWRNWHIELLNHCLHLLVNRLYYIRSIRFICLYWFSIWMISLRDFKTSMICTSFCEIIFFHELNEQSFDYSSKKCICSNDRSKS
jgi:hypothetical protein